MERYHISKRNSGKYGLLGQYGWLPVYKDGVRYAKVFNTYAEAQAYLREMNAEAKAKKEAEKAQKDELKAKVARFMEDNGITAEMKKKAEESLLEDQGDGTAIVHRLFKTATGKNARIEWNNGFTLRSRNCVTLYVDGVTIFTSGRIEKVVEYIITH